MAIHWIGAGANLITGSDSITDDMSGYILLYDEEAMALANLLQPLIPSSRATPPARPRSVAQMLYDCKLGFAGPSPDGVGVAVPANCGADSYLSKREKRMRRFGDLSNGYFGAIGRLFR